MGNQKKNPNKITSKQKISSNMHTYSLPLQITSKCFLDRWCFPYLDSSSNLLSGETKFSTELHIIHQQRINRLYIACSQIAAVLQCSTFRSPLRTASVLAMQPELASGPPLWKSLAPHQSAPSSPELTASMSLLKLQSNGDTVPSLCKLLLPL